MAPDPIAVRPTKRCLGDLDVDLPDLGASLSEVDEPVIVSAQAVPEQREAGGVERVVSLTDRVWFKVKTADRRAVVTELRGDELPEWIPRSRGAWWIGTAGRRQNDSPQRDFYAVLQRECMTGKTVSTDHLLPADWDWNRLSAEQGGEPDGTATDTSTTSSHSSVATGGALSCATMRTGEPPDRRARCRYRPPGEAAPASPFA
ncbi:hypothetical protein [Jiangella muralis]|uniref:hypothetical protein n=1 Tax=Jiangella muralis TaxID=702383 RepID=UPI000AD1AA98|nr:hypothetical protein [Jiangella muralis]